MSALAMFGGARAVPEQSIGQALVRWPVVTEDERSAVLRVLDSGKFTSNSMGLGEVQLLEREWAGYVGAPHCAALSNGTAAVALALAALGLQPGDEILVPALTFIGSIAGPVQRLIVPVFVDIDPRTFTMDPVAAEAAVTPRTRAVLAVHLHGLPCDMTALRELAERRHLLLVEDAAQAHGATYRGVRAGALGDAAAFSLNVTKNLPTCGEGGLVTTVSHEVHERMIRLRQFGEDLRPGRPRDYVSRVLAGNEKMSSVQAAFARSQLDRLPSYADARERNARRLFDRLGVLPGLVVPLVPEDRTHAWHILRIRFDPAAAGYPDVAPGPFRAALARVLQAEGVPVQPYQLVPLPGQRVFQTREGVGGGYPWSLPGVAEHDYRIEDHPVTMAVIEDSLTLQRWHLNPDSGPVLDLVADAFEKVWSHLDAVATIARSAPYTVPWAGSMAVAA
ncbi:DegT/DnrJ/EryC1/StrS family aminotransferase [Paractinoplanes rhizophilus]|uniref:DegT/DnrJ/EryC1/StrS family aminotransferase n=1 Tax=Paractinoplanes rhizophilus TaxID=1416877 RepID=A0ABW2I026_9ACTN